MTKPKKTKIVSATSEEEVKEAIEEKFEETEEEEDNLSDEELDEEEEEDDADLDEEEESAPLTDALFVVQEVVEHPDTGEDFWVPALNEDDDFLIFFTQKDADDEVEELTDGPEDKAFFRVMKYVPEYVIAAPVTLAKKGGRK